MSATSTPSDTSSREATGEQNAAPGATTGAAPAGRAGALIAPRLLGTRARWIALALGLVALVLFFTLVSDDWIRVVNLLLIYALAALGLNVLSGYTGQVSLGISFFMAIGAYTAAILGGPVPDSPRSVLGFGLPVFVWLPAAGIAAALVGALVGPSALRLKGFYLGIVSLALLYVGQDIFTNLPKALSSANGRSAAPVAIGDFSFALQNDVFGIAVSSEQAYFVLLVVLVTVCGLFVANVMRSRAGRAMQAVRDNEVGASIMGVNLFTAKMQAFMLSSFLAGVAGGLYAAYNRSISPTALTGNGGLAISIGLVAAILVGGVASVWGSILGAAFVFAFQIALQNLNFVSLNTSNGAIIGDLQTTIYGLLIVVFLLFEPSGIVGLLRRGRLQRPRFALRRRAGRISQTGSAHSA
jgi:branched-chain amino acid transport system permease protein